MRRCVGMGLLTLVLTTLLPLGCQRQQGNNPSAANPSSRQFSQKPKDTAIPKIVLPETSYNFGTMDPEQDGQHLFEIRNEGSGVLSLRFAEKTCGCTGLTIEDLVWTKAEKAPPGRSIEVPAGGKTQLAFDWNTEMRTALRTVAKLSTNDLQQQMVEFAVEGQVVPSVEVSRPQVTLAEMRNNEASTTTVEIYSRKLEDLEITECESSHDLVTAKWTPMSAERLEALSAKSGHRVTIDIAPGLPLGPFRARLTFHANSERRPQVTVDVAGKVTGDVLLTPFDSLEFRTVRVAEGSTLSLFVKVRGEEPVQITAGRVEPEFLNVQLVEVGKSRYRLNVRVPPGAPGGSFRGVIELDTTHPTAKVVKIPVRGDVIQ